MAAARVLITDDERDVRWLMATLLEKAGMIASHAENGRAALRMIRSEPVDCLLVDFRMPGPDGLQVLREAHKLDPDLPIILLTGFATVSLAVEAIKNGAFGVLTKPFLNEEFLRTVQEAIASRKPVLPREASLAEQMGPSEAVERITHAVQRVAPTDFTVIVQGETGTGKELIARTIHHQSQRQSGPFIAIDCGAIPPALIESELFGHERGAFTGADRQHRGCFEAAAGGTLFLDEIGNLPMSMQPKLLRALQEKQVRRVGGSQAVPIDGRVIAATNFELASMVEAGTFRRDLYHRINEFRLMLPALRYRADDILYLAQRFLIMTCHELGKRVPRWTDAATEKLRNNSWPGNVRELRNVVRRSALLAEDAIEASHLEIENATPSLPVEAIKSPVVIGVLSGEVPLKELVRQQVMVTEREIVYQALRQAQGNKAKAARLLQIDYKTMRTKAREYGLYHYRPEPE